MSVINFNFPNFATLRGMAPTALFGGAFSEAALPPSLTGAGIYIIWNKFTNNRYVGISNDLKNRFSPRMAIVTELGFSAAQMDQIEVFWGTASYQNTPAAIPGVIGSPPPTVVPVPNYAAPLNFAVDGVVVQFERLLIRFLLTQIGGPGTISNNMLAYTPYVNPTPHPIIVNFISAGSPTVHPFTYSPVWSVHGPAW